MCLRSSIHIGAPEMTCCPFWCIAVHADQISGEIHSDREEAKDHAGDSLSSVLSSYGLMQIVLGTGFVSARFSRRAIQFDGSESSQMDVCLSSRLEHRH